MELFRHRNLALGCSCFLALLLLSYYLNTIIRIAILVISGIAIIAAVLIYLISKKGFKALIRLIPILTFAALAMIVSLIAFDNSELLKYSNQDTKYEVECTVKSVDYVTEHSGIYTVNVHRVEGNQVDENAKLYTYGKALSRGDVVSAVSHLFEIENDPLDFDEKGYNLSKGIEVTIESDEFSVVGRKSTPLYDVMENVNLFLDSILSSIGDESTYSLLSALFLGNSKRLDLEVKRDFARLGLSHALALSGMHITIVVTILGLGIDRLNIRKIFKQLLLAVITLFFVGMTGFSDSAMRAGLMVCLVYLLGFFGRRLNMTTSLFLSVTVICIFDPYSIFSLSLMLSFFAMLGCITSSRLFKRLDFYGKIKNKLLRYVIFTFVTSVFAVLFTLLITYASFGNVPALSPVTNILLAPIFTFLIYLTPIYLVCAFIPYISSLVGWFLTQTSTFLIFVGEKLASINGISVPVINIVQIIGIAAAVVFVIALLLINKRLYKYALCGIMCGIVIFAIGTGVLYYDRGNNIYVGVAANSTGEAVFIEDENQLSIFEIGSSGSLAYYTAVSLGYYEVDRLVITDYSSKVCALVDTMCKRLILKAVYLPHPNDIDEDKILSQIADITRKSKTSLGFFGNTLKTKNTSTLIYTHKFDRSDKNAVALNISYGHTSLTYLGASTYEAPTYLINELAYKSDVVIFGSQGPIFKSSYEYDTPYLDYVVFSGKSNEYAKEDFYLNVQNKIKPYKNKPVRFKLKD